VIPAYYNNFIIWSRF